MQVNHFIGIDVSKNTLDISVVTDGKTVYYQQIANTVKEIKTSICHIVEQLQTSFNEVVFCMEHTGIYNLPMVKWLQTKEAKIWLESGLHISRTLGLVRGKNDKIDSNRIAMYAFANRHQIKLWKAPRPVIEKITALLSQRSRFVKVKKQLSTAAAEQALFMHKDITKSIQKYTDKTVQVIDKQIEAVEKEIMTLIKEDENLNRLYQLITSVEGIGFVTACHMLSTTNEFINIKEAKKYACYAGVVPFEHRSGTSVRGKSRVSKMANKGIKTLLHLAATSAIRMEGDLKQYYHRKVAEGKSKMSVLNAVRNKLILRVFACVNQNRKFEKNYVHNFG